MTLNNHRGLFGKRKHLRNNATPQEMLVWRELRSSRLGCKFRRQHSIGPYILDFYCPSKKLGIEIDGSQHFEDKAIFYDEKRSKKLAEYGVKVLRFTNREININMSGVLQKIASELS